MDLCTSRDISDAVHEKLLSELNDQFELNEDFKLIHKSHFAPSIIQLIADAHEWASPYLLESSRYLLEIAVSIKVIKIWNLRKEINKKMNDKKSEPLKKVVKILYQAKTNSRKDTQIFIGLPIPDYINGALQKIDNEEDFEIAWILANFIVKAKSIEDYLNSEIAKGNNPLGGFYIKSIGGSSIEISWKRQKDFKLLKMIIE